MNLTERKPMSDNCFTDTNILVYCYTDDEPEKKQKATEIANIPNSFISTQVLTELSNTLKRKLNLNYLGMTLKK